MESLGCTLFRYKADYKASQRESSSSRTKGTCVEFGLGVEHYTALRIHHLKIQTKQTIYTTATPLAWHKLKKCKRSTESESIVDASNWRPISRSKLHYSEIPRSTPPHGDTN